MQNDNMNNGQPNQRPVRPQMQQGQRPVRPQMQQGQRPVRPQMQGQRPNQQEHEQSPSRRQQPQMQRPEFEHSPSRRQQPQYQQQPYQEQQYQGQQYQGQQQYQEQQQYQDFGPEDNSFADFNSAVVNDTVAENKARGKKQKKVKEKRVLTPEQKKKRVIIMGAVAGGLAVLLIAFTFISKLIKNSNQHIQVAQESTVTPVEEEVENTETENNDTADAEQGSSQETEQTAPEKEETQTPATNIEAKQSSKIAPLDINEYSYMDTVVNTKTAQDTTYVDREAKVYIRMSNVVYGYDQVSKYVQEFNDFNEQNKRSKRINLPDSKQYYSQSNGTEMVMFEFEMLYPTDYPTSASEGVVYKLPQAEFKVYGVIEDIDPEDIATDEDAEQQAEFNPEDYLLVDDVIYNVSKVTDISMLEVDPEKGIKVGEPVVFRYVTALPVGSSNEIYEMTLDLDLDTEELGRNAQTYWFKGQDIGASDLLKQVQEELAQEQQAEEENTENTEDTTEENTDEQSEE